MLLPIHEIKANWIGTGGKGGGGGGGGVEKGVATEEGLLAFDTTVARGSNVTDSSSSLFRFLPLVRASRPPSPLPHPFKVPFDRPRSIKEGQISFYRLATLPSPFLILESVFNGSDPGRPQSFSFLPIFSRPRNRLLSILWLSVYDYKIRVLWSRVYPDFFFFFSTER